MTEEDFSTILDALKEDLKFYHDMIREVAIDVMAEGFSKYPVFVATEHEVSLGELVLSKAEYARDFNIYATTMEELVEKKLILASKKDEFIKAFRDPRKFMCVLLVTSETASYIFVPYKKRKRAEDDE
jgi:hypothetical protein